MFQNKHPHHTKFFSHTIDISTKHPNIIFKSHILNHQGYQYHDQDNC